MMPKKNHDAGENGMPEAVRVAVLNAVKFGVAGDKPDHFDALAEQEGRRTLDGFAVARILMKG